MKKLLAILLILCSLYGLALADETVLQPLHLVSMENYGAEDCTLPTNFETANAVDDSFRITYDVYQIDYYPAGQVAALQPGDKLTAFGMEFTVETIEQADGEININGESGLYLWADEDQDGLMICNDGTETFSSTHMGTFTLPLADKVRLLSYRMDEDGTCLEGMDEHFFTPAEVKTFLTEHGDSEKSNYLSAWGSATAIRVADGKVQEIIIDWSSDS